MAVAEVSELTLLVGETAVKADGPDDVRPVELKYENDDIQEARTKIIMENLRERVRTQ